MASKHATLIQRDRRAEEDFMKQKPPQLNEDVIRDVSVGMDKDGDFVVEFETYLRRYALVVVLADSTNMGWKECQAMADAMRVAERGTNINNHSFCNIFDTLKEKYGAVNGPLVENRRLVGLILPGPGDLRIKTGNVLSGLSFSFDSDGDILFKANTYSGKKFTIVQQLIGKNKSMMVMDCKAFIDILGMLETGDHVDELTFVSLVGALRTKYNFVKLGKVSGTLYASVVASRVANSEPIESVLLKAMQAKAPSKSRSTDTSPSVGASPSLPTCPYRGLSYTRALQESGQAQVYAGLGPDGEKVAIKVFKGSEEDASEGYRTELRMLLKMKEHRNVIECLQFFENPKPALVMRLVEGEGDMLQYIQKHGRFEEEEARRIARELGDGILHLHRAGIVHRDLKTPNVLLQKSDSGRLHPIVIDLGLGGALTKSNRTNVTMTMQQLVTSFTQTSVSHRTDGTKGSVLWMAPEMFARQEWSSKTDVYAFGIICYEMLTGHTPFDEPKFQNLNAMQLLELVARGVRPDMSRISANVSEDFRKLIEDCWCQDPSQRPNMQTVLDRLRGNDPRLIFEALDDDNSGTLDFPELVKFLNKYAKDVKPTEMANIFGAIDENDDGSISFPEFQKFWNIVQRNGLESALKLVQRSKSYVS